MIFPSDGMTFRDILGSGRFYYGAEVVTTRGFSSPGSAADVAALANDLLGDARIGWISITDNPGGAPMLPPDWLAGEVGGQAERRGRIVVHLTCKDANRNGLEAAAWRYAAQGLHNILAITGDCPGKGYGGMASGVFDLDSVGLITLLETMNQGLPAPDRRGQVQKLAATNFFTGCVVSPFKRHERELLPQYLKLARKLAAGARWVIPQLGYDMRKFHEVKLLLESRGLHVPVIGNVYLLTKGVAKLFNEGKLAGCVVSDSLMAEIDRAAAGADKGRKFFMELAAKQLAVFKGLGFAAGYLGGMAKADTFGQIIELADSFGENDWRDFIKEIRYSQPDEFFLFEHDSDTGLSSADRLNPAYVQSLNRPGRSAEVTLNYRISRWVHRAFFTRDRGFWNMMRRIYARLDANREGMLSRLAHATERTAKQWMYGCEDCGDCSLPDCGYLCPRFSCSKNGRNGPCGGSAGGRCEAGDKECFWARVYQRMKQFGESERMLERPPTLYNADLRHTSAWANAYLDRDHNATRSAEDEKNDKNH